MSLVSRFYNPACEERLRAALLDASPILDLVRREGGRAYLFAGAVRDVVSAEKLQLSKLKLRDLDIGIEGLPKERFRQIFKSHGIANNRYSGFRWKLPNQIEIDCWRLEDTVGLLKTNSSYCLSNVLRSFVLACNAIYFDVQTGEFFDKGAVQSFRSGLLDFVRDPLIHSEDVFSAKAIVYQRRFGFRLSPTLQRFAEIYTDNGCVQNELKKWRSTIQSRSANNDSHRSDRQNRQIP